MKRITAAGNTVVPALLVLEAMGFTVEVDQPRTGSVIRARRGEEEFLADDPVTVLGLVKLVGARSWNWRPADDEIEQTVKRYGLEGEA